MTKQELRDVLDELGLMTKADDGHYIATLKPDNDLKYGLGIVFDLTEDTGKLFIQGICPGLEISDETLPEAMRFCNQYNIEKSFLSVACDIENHIFYSSQSMLVLNPPDENSRKQIHIILVSMIHFYTEACKHFS